MSAMEKMLSSMLGFSTEEMQGMATNLQTFIKKIADDIEVIKANQELILSKLEGNENGNGDHGATEYGKSPASFNN
jgi:hypothetical protein